MGDSAGLRADYLTSIDWSATTLRQRAIVSGDGPLSFVRHGRPGPARVVIRRMPWLATTH